MRLFEHRDPALLVREDVVGERGVKLGEPLVDGRVALLCISFQGGALSREPVVDQLDQAPLGTDWSIHTDLQRTAGFAGAHLVLILNNHPAFAGMAIESLADSLARPGLIYDFWNHFEARDLRLPDSTGYMALGAHGVARLPTGLEAAS